MGYSVGCSESFFGGGFFGCFWFFNGQAAIFS